MNLLSTPVLLAVLVGVVPLIVLCAGGVAFLLLRAGFGIFVWAVLPLLGVLAVVAVLGLALSRAAGGKPDGEEPRRRNDV